MRHVAASAACPVLLAGALLCGGCAATPAPPATPALATAQVKAGLLNLLKCPSLNCDVIEDLHAGQKVAVLSPVINGWVQVRVPGTGQEGYVLARFLDR